MFLTNWRTELPNWKLVAEFFQALLTIAAILVGGAWTYTLFVQQRQPYPKLQIEHKVSHYFLPDKRILLTVDQELKNTGSVVLRLPVRELRVSQVLPFDPDLRKALQGKDPLDVRQEELEWPLLHQRVSKDEKDAIQLEPGESDSLHHELLLPGDVETVQVLSYLKNVTIKDRELGWRQTTLYTLEKPAAKKAGK
jgi:hypothetical protein